MTIHRHLFKAAALGIALAAALPALADPPVTSSTTTTTTTTTKHNYVYYKDRDIYFAPETKTWYWMSNGTWTSGVALPVEFQPYAKTGGVTIELDTMKPYERHDYVVSHYKTTATPAQVTTEKRVTTTTPTARTTTTTTTTKHRYVYYRDRDIYFAPETKTYYWMANGNWTSGTALPVEVQPYVKTGGVTIELDTERPYERHEYVIAHYKNKSVRDNDEDEEHH